MIEIYMNVRAFGPVLPFEYWQAKVKLIVRYFHVFRHKNSFLQRIPLLTQLLQFQMLRFFSLFLWIRLEKYPKFNNLIKVFIN